MNLVEPKKKILGLRPRGEAMLSQASVFMIISV
jgi:hypothetical protein